ncbi:MAG TPA: hypothetical protein VNR87_12480 [Flavisolibacter sp.]|nr:hypothetical protein [Flavisolibacter sp.]
MTADEEMFNLLRNSTALKDLQTPKEEPELSNEELIIISIQKQGSNGLWNSGV